MNSKFSHTKILKMVQIAFLAAVEVVLTLLYIPVGTINLNFGLVPIVIAGVFLGPAAGGIIGAVSGIVTMIQVLTGQSIFYVFLVATNPVMASLLCILKTGAAGLLSGLVYRLFSKILKFRTVNIIISSIICPVVNTGIFALGMFTVFGDALLADPVISTWAEGGLAAIVFVALIGVNFFVELISTVVISPALSKALFSSKLIKNTK